MELDDMPCLVCKLEVDNCPNCPYNENQSGDSPTGNSPLTYHIGDLLKADQIVIAHGCNCQGAMGAGIAKAIKERYPKLYLHYRNMCLSRQFRPGMAQAYHVEPKRWIVNLATQDEWSWTRPCAKIEWIGESVARLLRWCGQSGFTEVAIPRLGCNHGGLRWDDVEPVLEQLSNVYAIDIHVWDLQRPSHTMTSLR